MTSFEPAAQHITRFETTAPAAPYESQATLIEPQTAEHQYRPRTWQKRAAIVGALVVGAFGVEAATDAVASQAASPSCHGDYCSGQYADDTGCDRDARTLTTATISQSRLNTSITISREPGVTIGAGDSQDVGKLEVRASERCGTVWARLNTRDGARVSFNGINSLGIKQDGGYTQERHIGGDFNGSPSAVSFTPMIYGRDRTYKAFVESKSYNFRSSNGTYWVES